MFCYKCGKELPKNAAFCPFCGEKVMVDALTDTTEGSKEASAKTEGSKAEAPMSNAHVFGKLLMVILNVITAIMFFRPWFMMPVVSFFSEVDNTFSFMDLIKLFFNSGRLFKATNQSVGEILSEVPGGVKIIALILAALFFASVIFIILNVVFYFTDRITIKFQAIGCGFIGATLLSFGITIWLFHKKVDEVVGMTTFGNKIIILTTVYKWLWGLLIVTALLLFYFKKNSKYTGIVEDSAKEPLKINLSDSAKKKLKIAIIVVLIFLAVFAAIKIRNHFAKDSDGLTTAKIEDMLNSGKNKIDIVKGKDAFPDDYDRWDSTISFHINEADGAFVLWNCETYDDGDGMYRDGSFFDYDCFEGETGAIASKNCDITFYVMKPGEPVNAWASCPIGNYDDGDYSMGICGISDILAQSYDDYGTTIYEKSDWSDLSFGEYRIVMVCDHVKNVDIKFAYTDDHCDEYGNYGMSDYSYRMYYPGEY